jgi:hypothetical protein
MFFSINTAEHDTRFPVRHIHNGFYLALDHGWNYKLINDTLFFYKGYCDNGPLESILQNYLTDTTPQHSGNFCVIVVGDTTLCVTHDINRSFPLCVYNNEFLTNFPDDEIDLPKENVWSDTLVELSKNGIKFKQVNNQYNKPNFLETQSAADCVKSIASIIKEKLKFFDTNTLPVNSFLSGGVDTMMSYALAQSYINVNLVAAEHFDLTEFTLKNYQKITHNFWGYRQIHHWKNPTVLVSGACGDEVFLRGPDMAALWCAWNNYNVVDVLDSIEYSYHKKYFLKPDKKQIFVDAWNNRSAIQNYSYSELCEKICNNVVNDHQHWHIENTITWTPFKDIRILHEILRLPKEDLFDQILYGSIDRKIIAEFNPELNHYVCDHKNHNQFHNLLKYDLYMKAVTEC